MARPKTYFLVKSFKNGNLAAFEKIYKLYYSKLFFFAKKFEMEALQPQDFVHQTFLRLWEARAQIKEDVLLDKQIYTICRNLLLNHIKREKRNACNQGFLLPEHELSTYGIEEGPSAELLTKLNDQIMRLPKKRRKVFLLHKKDNLSYEEISNKLSISKKTIANHIYLATDFLKKELKK